MARVGHAVVLGLAIGMAVAVACGDSGTFACVQDSQCVAGGEVGTCQDNGACSFPDPDCASGQRYGDLVGGALAGMCVQENEDTSATSGTPTATSSPMPDESDSGSPVTTVAIEDSGGSASTNAPTTAVPTDDTSSSGMPAGESSSTGEPVATVTLHFGERDDADVSGVTIDTYVALTTPGNNGGAHADVHVVQEGMPAAALLAFDLSSIPPGSEVVDATLELWTEGTGYLFAGHVEMRRMLEPWEEGDGDHSPGVPNWTERAAGELWATEGAGAPGSSEDTVLGTLDADVPRQSYSVAVPVDVVQDWVDTPSDNFGLRLEAVDYGDDYAWYLSSEYATVARRPALFVTFVPTTP